MSVNQFGVADETIEEFAARNDFAARVPTVADDQIMTIPFLPIDGLDFDRDRALEECKALEHCFVPHRVGGSHQGWSSLCLHGISSVHIGPATKYGYTDATAPWRWTDVADRCPTLTAFFQTTFAYESYFRLRIMKLAPGGYIRPHRDTLEPENARLAAVNVAVNNPDDCHFFMDGVGKLPFAPGRAIKLNLYQIHAVWNRSSENRYHVIAHGKAKKDVWHDRIRSSYHNWKS